MVPMSFAYSTVFGLWGAMVDSGIVLPVGHKQKPGLQELLTLARLRYSPGSRRHLKAQLEVPSIENKAAYLAETIEAFCHIQMQAASLGSELDLALMDKWVLVLSRVMSIDDFEGTFLPLVNRYFSFDAVKILTKAAIANGNFPGSDMHAQLRLAQNALNMLQNAVPIGTHNHEALWYRNLVDVLDSYGHYFGDIVNKAHVLMTDHDNIADPPKQLTEVRREFDIIIGGMLIALSDLFRNTGELYTLFDVRPEAYGQRTFLDGFSTVIESVHTWGLVMHKYTLDYLVLRDAWCSGMPGAQGCLNSKCNLNELIPRINTYKDSMSD